MKGDVIQADEGDVDNSMEEDADGSSENLLEIHPKSISFHHQTSLVPDGQSRCCPGFISQNLSSAYTEFSPISELNHLGAFMSLTMILRVGT